MDHEKPASSFSLIIAKNCHICQDIFHFLDAEQILVLQSKNGIIFVHKNCIHQDKEDIRILIQKSIRAWWYDPQLHYFFLIDKKSHDKLD